MTENPGHPQENLSKAAKTGSRSNFALRPALGAANEHIREMVVRTFICMIESSELMKDIVI